jgi:hypothetical protein
MRFKELYRDDDRFYVVGLDEDSGVPIIVVTTTGIAWRDFHFRLTDEEFDSFKQDPHALDDLAERMAHDKGARYYADRVIKP